MCKKNDENNNYIVWLLIALAAVFLFLGINYCIGIHLNNENPTSSWGQWGDIFGIASALFSGVTVAFVIYGVRIQHDDTKRNRSELKKQERQRTIQNFESIFFKMLENFTNLVNQIDLRKRAKITSAGKDAIREFAKRALFNCKQSLSINFNSESFSKEYNNVYDNFVERNKIIKKSDYDENDPEVKIFFGKKDSRYSGGGEELFPYFRTVYVILKYIRESDLEESEKNLYIRVFRATLSEAEIELIALNALSKHAMKNGKYITRDLIEKSALLKNINNDGLKQVLLENGHYTSSAFGEKTN